ncbi:MAG: hypothetical protein D6798_04320 [Deltaproteobacteria bacterium]|nr:MAG: hypothetical protein D6798_04320 [Deltaproteobacteria bacterium]
MAERGSADVNRAEDAPRPGPADDQDVLSTGEFLVPPGSAVGEQRPVPNPGARAEPVLTWKRSQNMQVVSLAEGAYVGRLDDFQFDLESHRIYGWRLKSGGMFGRSGGVAAAHLSLLGRDVAFLDTEQSVEWGPTARRPVDGRAWASAYRGTPAITRRGRSLGPVQDFVLDVHGSRITAILIQGDRLLRLDGRVHLGPAAVIATSMDDVVELGEGDPEPEGPTWWARLKEALGFGDHSRAADRGEDPALPVEMATPVEDD